MKTLFGSLSICVGFYLATYSGRLIVLRSIGHSRLFALLDWLMGCSPFASIAILLLVGIAVVLKNADGQPRTLIVKLPLTFLVAVIPLAVHLAMIKLTYSVDSPPPKLWETLSVSEWIILVLGCFLIGMGVFLLVRTRNHEITVPQF